MDIAFVKNSQDHIHDKDRPNQKQWQGTEELPKDQRLALERRLHTRVLALDLVKRIFNVLRCVPDRDTRKQIKIDCHTGELIEMIHCLRTDDLFRGSDGAQRNEIRRSSGRRGSSAAGSRLSDCAAIAAADIQIIQIARLRALVVFYFKNDLILVVWLFD